MKTFTLLDTFLLDGFYVTQNYFNNKSYYSKFNLLGHEGVDFGHANKKKMARTPISGTAFVGWDDAYGWFTVIENYKQECGVYICHMIEPVVVSGQEVKAGDEIGEMDDTGNANGEHVHFNFIILNSSGSNKYRKKEYNWGYLDPMYPRDTGNPVTFTGVEDYEIEWVVSLNNEEEIQMPETIAVDKQTWERIRNNSEVLDMVADFLLVKRSENGQPIAISKSEIQTKLEKLESEVSSKESDIKSAKENAKKELLNVLSSAMGIEPETTAEGFVSALDKLIGQSNSSNSENSSNCLPLLPSDSKFEISEVTLRPKVSK